ncbi:MAG: hypothetical protein O3A36_03280 [bacterium]|nr:hypothetical protein [bacterium]
MKRFLALHMLNKKNIIIIFALLAFGISFFLDYFLHLRTLLHISGFFLAIYIPGFAIKNIFDSKGTLLGNLIAAPVFTIFFFVPIYFGVTKALYGHISLTSAIIAIAVVALFSILKTLKDSDPPNSDASDKKYLLFGIGVFLLVHVLTTLAYQFVPEIDGYADIVKVEEIISSNVFSVTLRPFFTLLASYVSLISDISPYNLFKFGMVLIHIPGMYYLYQITKIVGLKSSFTKYLILLSFVSVPVINLEIDYVRPHVIFMSAILPFIYYLGMGIAGQKRNLIFSTIIATAGLFFHEFFGILFLINTLFIFHHYYKKLSTANKLLALFASAIGTIVLLINIQRLPVLPYILYSIQQFIGLIIGELQWKWWFLGTYANLDNNNLGWNGPLDSMKYYAYSLSPMIMLVLFAYPISVIRRLHKNTQIHPVESIASFILIAGLVFAELLPRINYPTLPDRFWPMISLSLLVLVPFVFVRIPRAKEKFAYPTILILLLIGIGGSVHVAKEKRGYTSEREYRAAQWMKENTSHNAIFITQISNGPMVTYFAKRNIVVPHASFFRTEPQNKRAPTSQRIYGEITRLISENFHNPGNNQLNSLHSSLKKYYEEIDKEKLVNSPATTEFVHDQNNLYVLYSKDKFSGYYGKRQWWKTANFYDADLSKFREGYDLVYNDSDRVYIWKKK